MPIKQGPKPTNRILLKDIPVRTRPQGELGTEYLAEVYVGSSYLANNKEVQKMGSLTREETKKEVLKKLYGDLREQFAEVKKTAFCYRMSGLPGDESRYKEACRRMDAMLYGEEIKEEPWHCNGVLK